MCEQVCSIYMAVSCCRLIVHQSHQLLRPRAPRGTSFSCCRRHFVSFFCSRAPSRVHNASTSFFSFPPSVVLFHTHNANTASKQFREIIGLRQILIRLGARCKHARMLNVHARTLTSTVSSVHTRYFLDTCYCTLYLTFPREPVEQKCSPFTIQRHVRSAPRIV